MENEILAMTEQKKTSVQMVAVESGFEGQRIDNFLRNRLKGVPKSVVYRIIRKGEVRVNKKRIKPEYKLQVDDMVRIPPVKYDEKPEQEISTSLNVVASLQDHILYEDKDIIVINKPAGMAVHGGSGLNFGLIEALRSLRPDARQLELVHRLDRDTSGCLLIAKNVPCYAAFMNSCATKPWKKTTGPWSTVPGTTNIARSMSR